MNPSRKKFEPYFQVPKNMPFICRTILSYVIDFSNWSGQQSSRKHLRTKVTPDLHLTYIKNWGNLRLVLNDKKWKFLHKIICCGDLLESPRGGDSNR